MIKINYTLVEIMKYINFLMNSYRFYGLGKLNWLKKPPRLRVFEVKRAEENVLT